MEECGLQFFTFEQAHSRPYRSEFRYRPFWPAVLLALTTAAAIVTLFGAVLSGAGHQRRYASSGETLV